MNMNQTKSFASYLATDDFLPGILALHESLRKYNNQFGFLLLVSYEVSSESLALLKSQLISLKLVEPITNPNRLQGDIRRFNLMYTKLRMFELVEYEKVVYLDADMIICGNIESLFDKPHMAAVNAGGILLQYQNWIDLNAGLLVISPNIKLFEEIMHVKDTLYSKDGSDQGFLHSFFPEWPSQAFLHLDHRYNVPASFINDYCYKHGYKLSLSEGVDTPNRILVVHFWGVNKPWRYRSEHYGELKLKEVTEFWWSNYRSVFYKLLKNRANRGYIIKLIRKGSLPSIEIKDTI